MIKKTYFNEEWLIEDSYPEIASWLVKGKENTQTKCKLYHKVIELSNIGIQALKVTRKERNISQL